MKNAQILVVDDEADIRGLLEEILSEEGYDVATAGDAAAARETFAASNYDLVLLDIWMPDVDGISLLKEWSSAGADTPVVMMSGHGTVDTAVEATRLGALDFIEKPVSLAKLLRVVEEALAKGNQRKRRRLMPSLLAPVGRSAAIQGLRDQAKRIATHDTPLLITGEMGTGREAFARYIHSHSDRQESDFIRVSCVALNDADAREQLLGESGQSDSGLLAQSDKGVIFFSDLGDMGETAQGILLSVLESGTYRPAWSGEDRRFSARVLASAGPGFDTDPGSFRRDLLSALGVARMRVPALRDYAQDVPELLRYYVDMLVDSEGLPFRRFSVAAQNRLRNYPWPGNIAELKNLVQRLLMNDGPQEIPLKEVEAELSSDSPTDQPLVKQDLLALPLREAREQFERAYLQQQLELCHGKVGQLAKRVGMERTHLYRKLRALGVDFRQVAADD